MRQIPQPTGALAEMLERDGELDRILDGRGLDFSKQVPDPPPAAPGPPLYIEPVDWHEEERQRLIAERQSEQAELEPAEPPPKPTPPASKRTRWRR